MHSIEQTAQRRNFFKLQVYNRSIKRLTKEIQERRIEVARLNETMQMAKATKEHQSILKHTKDDLTESVKTLKVTVNALGGALTKAEEFLNSYYKRELEFVLSERTKEAIASPSQKNEVFNEIRDLIQTFDSSVLLCPELVPALHFTSFPLAAPSGPQQEVNGLRKAEDQQTIKVESVKIQKTEDDEIF